MTEESGEGVETIVVDGMEVSVSLEGDVFRLVANERELGTLELVPGGAGFVARRANGDKVMRPSQWGGEVTARFQSRELAVRALLVPRT